ncbi:unnamed protein product [Paramecium primaurelia]|uniref:SP-RING-type domain-containing protein n=1 Tax=Paramecium primaurelia TaxID=5886 RepID=A0A8S1LA04_PARPR|nr:unnamed protein product [Paramecium primaurelia]
MNQNNQLQEEIIKELLTIKQDIEFKVPEFIRQGCVELKVDQISFQKKQDIIKCLGGNKYKQDQQFIPKLTESLLSHLLRMRKCSLQSTNINPARPIYLGQLITITMFYYEDKIIKSYSILEELTKFINKQIHIYYETIRDRLKLIKDKEQQLLNQLRNSQSNNDNQNETQKNDNFIKCYCHSQPGLYEQIKTKLNTSKVLICKFCQQNFHGFCLQINKNIQDFTCPYCTIVMLNPQNKVIDQIVQSTFQQFLQLKNEKHFLFNCPFKHKGSQIEIRCLRIDGKDGLNEITWPDYGELQINGVKITEFKPLSINYRVMKRKDNSINITNYIKYNEQNQITLIEYKSNEELKKQFRIQHQCIYFLGIFSINQMNAKEFLLDIKQYHKNYLSIEDSFKLFKQECSTKKDVKIKSIKISLLCPITLQLINIPARGRFCNHLQCFDLENFIIAIDNQKDKKIWKCPICKLKCFKFLIDDYQQLILELISGNRLSNKEVEFNENGEITDKILRELCNQHLKNQYQINDRIKKLIKND